MDYMKKVYMMITTKDILKKFPKLKTMQLVDLTINNVARLQDANEYSLVWIKSSAKNKVDLARMTKAKLIITDHCLCKSKSFIITDSPKVIFSKIAYKFFKPKEARIIKGSNVVIGKNVVIGGEGFGYEFDDDVLVKFPHYGGVIIESDVDIGNNTCIDRGALGNTIIMKGTKIDNLVHIAHNVEIGERCLVVANVGIGGSVKIGNDCYIGFGATIKNGVKIGNNVVVGMGAVVLRDIPDNEVWVGNPARNINEKKRKNN
jgi:UDP-3-O-[3-hydroxymyristoyl] glucosamine N-acyltransferase